MTRVRKGESPEDVAQSLIPLIVNEGSSVLRAKRCKEAAEALKIPYDALWQDVQAAVDAGASARREAKIALASRISKQAMRAPAEISSILTSGLAELTNIDREREEYAETQMIELVDEMDRNFEGRRRLADLRTGWPIFDDEFGGIPSKHAYISMPGKGHHGKTSVAVDLARRLIEFNPEVYDAIVPKVFAGFCFVPLRRKATGCGEMKQFAFLHYSRPLYKDLGAYTKITRGKFSTPGSGHHTI